MRYFNIALEFKKGQLPILKNWASPKKIGLPAHFLGLPIFDMNALIVAKASKPIRKMAKLKGVLGKTEQHQAEGPIPPNVFYKKLSLKLAGIF